MDVVVSIRSVSEHAILHTQWRYVRRNEGKNIMAQF